MARPRIYHEPRVVTAVRFPVEVRTRLDAAARARRTSVSALVNDAVTGLLDSLDAASVPSEGHSDTPLLR
jgi:hypothetical protein